MEKELNALYAAREEALRNWDASEYNRIDVLIRQRAAYMRAEINLGIRDEPFFSCEAK